METLGFSIISMHPGIEIDIFAWDIDTDTDDSDITCIKLSWKQTI